MKLVKPKGEELEKLRSEDPEGTAWIDELEAVNSLGQLAQLFDRHHKKVKLLSISMPPRKPPQAPPEVEKPR